MKISYFDMPLTLPAGVVYIATDEDGRVYGYSRQPVIDKGVWQRAEGRMRMLGRMDERPFEHWTGSLIRVDQLISPQPLKQVFYKGGVLQVPESTTHMATQQDGTIIAFTGRPKADGTGWHGMGYIVYTYRLKTDNSGYSEWAESCMEISK